LARKLSNNANEGDILLVAVDNDEIIRQISLFGNTQMRRRHAAMFGFAVIEHAQGKGVGSALMKVMIDYADKWTTFLRIELTVYAHKDSGIALYKKFGFEQEGLLRNYSLKNGRFENVIVMARFNPNQAIAK
jgi:putative acetyltransferase